METNYPETITCDQAVQQIQHCSYCGAPLNHAFYFCISCATPYKAVCDVISPAIKRQPVESELIRQKAPNVWRLFWTYAIVIFIVTLFHVAIGDDEQAVRYSTVFGTVCFIVTTAVCGFIFRTSLAVQLRKFGLFNKHTFFAFAILPFLMLLNYAYLSLLTYLEPGITPFHMELSEAGFGSVSLFVLFCLVPGITEEIAFRGLIQHWLHTSLKPWRAMVLASALFAALHLSIASAPYLFLVGMLLGWLKWKTRSLYPSMLIHIAHNFIVITVFPLLLQQ